ncbi:hypothetical protein FN976_22630 [Caenimonas sedimenti]|uniref:Apple domain-containing protein n=1 Tax=Caenimonas sedimenti TaxID=2596921 RepID=A0A562ZJ43_9BURK|nr:PAN domain-containing protein [Caenimonas sedimenti]TWO68431.1 hypothetical protein FN976_22630 [Caenimonas sedimenti]
MRTMIAAAGLMLSLLLGSFAAPAAAYERDSNRPGSDYRNFELRRADPQACQAECDGDKRCDAWTYVKPGVQGARARCWLKDSVPRRRNDECCVSGLRSDDADRGGRRGRDDDRTERRGRDDDRPERRGRDDDSNRRGNDSRDGDRPRAAAPVPPRQAPAAPVSPGAGTNLPGGDYRNFDLTGTEPQECRAACDADGRCKSWTFVRPGFQNEHARCWLKSTVPAAVRDACCTAGVKGR